MKEVIKRAEDALVKVLTENPQLRDDLFPVIEAIRVCTLERNAHAELCNALLDLGFRVERGQVQFKGTVVKEARRILYMKNKIIYTEGGNDYKTSAIANALFNAHHSK